MGCIFLLGDGLELGVVAERHGGGEKRKSERRCLVSRSRVKMEKDKKRKQRENERKKASDV